MGKALLLTSNLSTAAPTSARYWPMGNAEMYVSTSEATQSITARVPGTLSKLAVRVDATGTGRSFRVRKNTADGNQTLSPTDSTSGIFEDNSNSDAVAAADLIAFKTSGSTGSPIYYWARQVFSATTGHATYHTCATNGNYTTASASRFNPLAGTHAPQSTQANAQCKIRAPGTLQNGQVYVSANGRATDSILYSSINGVRGNIVITIGAGLTGLFEDTVHTDTLADGDLVGWELVTGSGAGTLTVQRISSAVVAASGNANDIFAGGNSLARAASGTPDYLYIAGQLTAPGSEALANVRHGFPAILSALRFYVSANTCASTVTVVLRVNGVDTPLTFTIGAAATGWFEDTTHAVAVGADDDVCISIVGGTSGSLTIRAIGLTERERLPRVQAFMAG